MNILFYIDTTFPTGSAWAQRGTNFARLFKELGYNIFIISRLTSDNSIEPRIIRKFESINYLQLRKQLTKKDFLYFNKNDFKVIEEYISNNKIDIIFTSAAPLIITKLLRLSKSFNIPIYVEQCEWYDSGNFSLGIFNPLYLRILYNIKYVYKKATGIIAISRLLEEHYKQHNSQVIRIPSILDCSKVIFDAKRKLNKTVNIVFAGNIGNKKEMLKPILEAILYSKNFININFDIYGPSESDILKNIDNDIDLLNSVKENIKINGKVPFDSVLEKIKDSDFMIFIRPNRRSSKAGFPTKLAESMAVGTPVITNNTGDINMYLNNGYNGFLLDSDTYKSVVEIFKIIIKLNDEEYMTMRENARKSAEIHFDFRNYKKVVDDFFAKV